MHIEVIADFYVRFGILRGKRYLPVLEKSVKICSWNWRPWGIGGCHGDRYICHDFYGLVHLLDHMDA